MTSTIFFGQKNSCCNSSKTAELESSNLSATSTTDACCATTNVSCCSISLCEDTIREKAYFLWEEAGRPESNGIEFWIEAERQLQSKN